MKKSLILLPLALFALSIVACNNGNNQNNNSNNTQQNTGTVSGVSLNYEKLKEQRTAKFLKIGSQFLQKTEEEKPKKKSKK